MRILAALTLAAAALTASAQTSVSPAAAACPDCGVIRTLKRVEGGDKPAMQEERKGPSGLVANIPLGGGKASVGSSTELSREQRPATVTYEVVVTLSDGRLRLVRQDDVGTMREGDKVKIEQGRVVPRPR
jgi:hypothetical protein